MDSDAAWIEELAKHNQMPSEEEIQAVRRLLVKPMEDIQHLDSEILDLNNRLSELNRQRNEVEKRISLLNRILSPIRRVPQDVLGEIFYRCLTTHRNPIMRSDDCPLLLTQVCSPWRSFAIATPRLWERLYLTFTDDDTVPDVETAAAMARNQENPGLNWSCYALSESEKERVTLVLRRRFDLMKEWISRSGTSRPLSLSVFFSTQSWYAIPHSRRPPSVTMDFLSFLATLSPRLKNLELQTSLPIYNALEKMFSASKMTALTSLRVKLIDLHLDVIGATPAPGGSFELIQAPNLQRLSISGDDLRNWGIDDASLKCQWHKLTNLTCLDALTFDDAVFLLERSSNLVHFRGVIEQDLHDASPPIFYEGHISLPFLQTLSISEDMKPGHMGNFYDRIEAPSLHSVENYGRRYHGDLSTTHPWPISILPLLRKSTGLQELRIDTQDLTYCELGILLRAVPTITHLVVGHQDRHADWSDNLVNYAEDGTLFEPSWSFSNLIVDHTPEDDQQPLLPLLTSLVIISTTSWITEDIVFDIVRSRMLPTTRNAALNHVKVRFYKTRTRDIEERLNDCADSFGVKIDLNIKYPPPNPPDRNPLSAEFGLIGPFGMSWPYVDAGEDLQIW